MVAYVPTLCVCLQGHPGWEIHDQPQNSKMSFTHTDVRALWSSPLNTVWESERARETEKFRQFLSVQTLRNLVPLSCGMPRAIHFPLPFLIPERQRGFILRAWNNDTYHPFDCQLVSLSHSISSDRVSPPIKVSHRLVSDFSRLSGHSNHFVYENFVSLGLHSHFLDWGNLSLSNCSIVFFLLLTFFRERSLFPPLPSSHFTPLNCYALRFSRFSNSTEANV